MLELQSQQGRVTVLHITAYYCILLHIPAYYCILLRCRFSRHVVPPLFFFKKQERAHARVVELKSQQGGRDCAADFGATYAPVSLFIFFWTFA